MLKELIGAAERLGSIYRQCIDNIENEDAMQNLLTQYQSFKINSNVVNEILTKNVHPQKVVKIIIEEEQKIFQVSLVIIPKSFTIPLHDHPKMHSFLRVLAGSVSIDRFSIMKDEQLKYQQKYAISKIFSDPEEMKFQQDYQIDAIKNQKIFRKNDFMSSGIKKYNIYSIQALNDSIILQTLVPTYDILSCGDVLERFINFYEIIQPKNQVHNANANIFQLKMIKNCYNIELRDLDWKKIGNFIY